MLDPVSDMLTRIRNAQFSRKREVSIPASKLKRAIAKLLAKRKFLGKVEDVSIDDKPFIKIELLYNEIGRTNREGVIREIEQVSKQSKRVYIKGGDIRKVKNGLGVAVISTSKGIMAGEEAYKQGVGGEYICKVW